jgi:hypothetical protein
MRRVLIFLYIFIFFVTLSLTAYAASTYIKVASFKDIGQSRAFFIAFKNEIDSDHLEEKLWEIVDYHMEKYGQAPQMWIYFFDMKKYTPKDFPIQGESLDHLIAQYFYATDTRKKDLKILSSAERTEIQKEGGIDSPLWTGQ